MVNTKKVEKKVSSLDLLWNQAFLNLDAWVEREEVREDHLLQSTKNLAENVKKNQTNFKELSKQFTKELFELENKSREGLLLSTISLQSLFPIKSYEEINNQLDNLKNKTSELVLKPFDHIGNAKFVENYVSVVEKYIEFRRNNRNLYVKKVKDTALNIQVNQSALLNLITKPVRNVIFPFNKFIERSHELTK
ncbi:hypothetical protein [Bacillus sp. AFS031507]|uniref:hypothetical protein n=1 Tax=Bacillus sp. AFS031507 TaxID=2033496 RepID=UPI000BFE224F|nr:hypothetical protein [Bacillus sp. AFS031507]PGY12973.1 hypothetical protein COE25_07285 [Bacillus sp. AFS031507]